MKKMRKVVRTNKLFLMLLLVMGLLFAQACNNDDATVVAPTEATDTDGSTDPENPDDGTSDENDDETNEEDGAEEDEEDEEDLGEITLYQVRGKTITKQKDFAVTDELLDFQKDTLKHREIWDVVLNVVPPGQLSKISQFMIFSGDADGTAGYVFPTADDLSTWHFAIAIDLAYDGGFDVDGELTQTIVHEFGHIVTLQTDQLDPTVFEEEECENFYLDEGCSYKTSYINEMFGRYWADIWEEHKASFEDEEKAQAFFEKYESRFVTGYAVTHPAEDIAEVFAFFVTRAEGQENDDVSEQKIGMLYEYPELITLREYARGNEISAKGKSAFAKTGKSRKARRRGQHRSGCVRTAIIY